MKITIEQEEPKMPQSNNCRITEVHVKINNTESLENLLEAFRGVLFTMGYHPDLIDSHVSLSSWTPTK